MSKFFPEAISACKEQLKKFASHANHSHPCVVELYIKLITSLSFFKIGIKNHTSDWSELSGKARVSIMKQMLIERPIIYLPRKNSATASGSICDYFFVLGNDANDLLCFFANIGLISPFLQSYTCLKTML